MILYSSLLGSHSRSPCPGGSLCILGPFDPESVISRIQGSRTEQMGDHSMGGDSLRESLNGQSLNRGVTR